MEVSLLMFLLSVDSVPLQDVSKALFLFENRFLHSRRKLKNRIFFASLQLNILHFVDIGNNLSETHVCMFLQQRNLFFFLSTLSILGAVHKFCWQAGVNISIYSLACIRECYQKSGLMGKSFYAWWCGKSQFLAKLSLKVF